MTCDLIEICRQTLSQEINLIREIEKICRICPSNNEQIDSKEKPTDLQKEKLKRPFGMLNITVVWKRKNNLINRNCSF